MSLDLWMEDKNQEEQESFNYTYNVSKMWKEATGDDQMIPIEGLTGREAKVVLTKALKELESNPEKYQAMNPPNKWGSYLKFMQWIERLIQECENHPNLTWVAGR